MFYSYGNETPGWKSDQKYTLAKRLGALIEEFLANNPRVSRTIPPYVEVDLTEKDAVVIRRITRLSSKLKEKLISQADAVYKEVMGL